MRIRALSLFFCCLCFGFFPGKVLAQDSGWVVDQFDSQIIVHKDSSVSVEETITVDFADVQKHGIFRNIPVNYRDRLGNKLNVRLKVLSVTDEQGNSWNYQTKISGSDLEIKIGDPDRTVSGNNVYKIRYVVNRVITRFSDHDELYWNVTGDEWPVPIRRATATVLLPEAAGDATCYSGAFGSSFKNCSVSKQGTVLVFSTDASLSPASGFTIVTASQKGDIDTPPVLTRIWWFVSDNWPFAFPVAVLLILLWLYWQHGRDEHYKSLFDPSMGTEKLAPFTAELVPSTYAPLNDISPAEAGTLIDEAVDIRDIASTIIDLAVRGYLTIEEIENKSLWKDADFTLKRTQKDTAQLEDYEQKLLAGLFKVGKTTTLSAQKYKFYSQLGKIRDSLYERMVTLGYFRSRPDKIVQVYRGIGLGLVGLGFFLGAPLGSATGQTLAWILGPVVSGILVLLFAKAMPKRTAKGRRQYLRVLGLRNFVSLGAYREQIWERANLFEEVLPFAIAFNLTHRWVEAFKTANLPPPDWYRGAGSFNALTFSHSMEHFTQMTSANLPAVRSTSASGGGSGFGGGGSSGGGFGGGGGGSW